MKNILIVCIIFLLQSCNYGIWVNGDTSAYRPKFDWYSIDEDDFNPHPLIDTNYFYKNAYNFILSDNEISNDFYGFTSDGKVINVHTRINEHTGYKLKSYNTWETAQYRGYYTTKGDRIIFGVFIPIDYGIYRKEEAIIKKDTLLIERKSWENFYTYYMSYTPLVKTKYRLGKGE